MPSSAQRKNITADVAFLFQTPEQAKPFKESDWGFLRGKPQCLSENNHASEWFFCRLLHISGSCPRLRVPSNIRILRLSGVESRLDELISTMLFRCRGGDSLLSPSPCLLFFIEETDYLGHPKRPIRDVPLTNRAALIRLCRFQGLLRVYRADRFHALNMGGGGHVYDLWYLYFLACTKLRSAPFSVKGNVLA